VTPGFRLSAAFPPKNNWRLCAPVELTTNGESGTSVESRALNASQSDWRLHREVFTQINLPHFLVGYDLIPISLRDYFAPV